MRKRKKDRADAVQRIMDTPPSFTDPQGSWTGLPADEHETPVQDADDLLASGAPGSPSRGRFPLSGGNVPKGQKG